MTEIFCRRTCFCKKSLLNGTASIVRNQELDWKQVYWLCCSCILDYYYYYYYDEYHSKWSNIHRVQSYKAINLWSKLPRNRIPWVEEENEEKIENVNIRHEIMSIYNNTNQFLRDSCARHFSCDPLWNLKAAFPIGAPWTYIFQVGLQLGM